jgi:hypothetical protein
MSCQWIAIILLMFDYQQNVRSELSSSSCSALRTMTSLAKIAPEMTQLAIRYYGLSATSDDNGQHRVKRFLFDENPSKSGMTVKGTVVEQMVANTLKDVDFTKVALLILKNEDTMAKLRQNIDSDVIVRAIMHDIDYEVFGQQLWHAIQLEFNFEQFITNIINMTRMDSIHRELFSHGTLPEWLIKGIHPDFDVETIDRMVFTLRNLTEKFVRTMNDSQQFEAYLFKMIQTYILVPARPIIQRMKDNKPSTLDQLVELILSNINQVLTVGHCCQ